jgi:hypothetical protein
MHLALSLGRASFAVAIGILIGAGAAVIGVEVATRGHEVPVAGLAHLAPPPLPDPQTIVDVSRGALARTGGVGSLAELLHIGPDRSVMTVNGQTSDQLSLSAAWNAARPGEYLDLQLYTPGLPSMPRIDRVLVLVHP